MKIVLRPSAALPHNRTCLSRRGQILVEFAVLVPVLLFIILGAIEAGFLVNAKAAQDRSTAVVAEWAAEHPGESWNSVAARELPGCDVMATNPHQELVEITATCLYSPVVLVMFEGLPMTSSESAVTQRSRGNDSPSTAPDASPSSS